MGIQREQVVEAALALLDEAGLEGMTMRKLAQRLNIQAPSLYWHFASKQALVDGMADALVEPGARELAAGLSWDEVLRRVAAQLRQALLSRRDGSRVFAGTYIVTENILRLAETLMGALQRAGASPRAAAWGSFSLVYYVIGFTLEEQALDPRFNPEPMEPTRHRALFSAFAPERFPHVFLALDDIVATDLEARFTFGLERFISGLRADLPAPALPRGRKTPR